MSFMETETEPEEHLPRTLQISTWMNAPGPLQHESRIIKLSSNFFSVVNLLFQPAR